MPGSAQPTDTSAMRASRRAGRHKQVYGNISSLYGLNPNGCTKPPAPSLRDLRVYTGRMAERQRSPSRRSSTRGAQALAGGVYEPCVGDQGRPAGPSAGRWQAPAWRRAGTATARRGRWWSALPPRTQRCHGQASTLAYSSPSVSPGGPVNW